LIDGLVIDEADVADRDLPEIAVKVTRTLMQSDADRDRLAVETLAFADELAHKAKVS
jgi:LPPG:FO 2-phospho-L-lactate transferase